MILLCAREAAAAAGEIVDPRPTGAPGLLTPFAGRPSVPVPIASINGWTPHCLHLLGVRLSSHIFAQHRSSGRTAEITQRL